LVEGRSSEKKLRTPVNLARWAHKPAGCSFPDMSFAFSGGTRRVNYRVDFLFPFGLMHDYQKALCDGNQLYAHLAINQSKSVSISAILPPDEAKADLW
jgi:hypothetical protein